MNIIVLNGSPKGKLSGTMQYVAYLAKLNPQHAFKILHVAQRIKLLESSREAFDEVIAEIRAADGVLWGFPLYYMIVHAHYKRFIELVFERGVQNAFAGKYAASLSTSIHFYDHTAHNYIHGISDDLGMRFVESFSAGMGDLLKEADRRQLALFGKHFLETMQTRAVTQRQYPPVTRTDLPYQPGPLGAPLSTAGKKVLIVHDNTQPGSNLEKMVTRCQAIFGGAAQVINLHDIDIKSSCQGCMRCGASYHCAFEGKDGFIDFYRSAVMRADVLVYAGSVVDRYLSSRWKTLFDRSFFNTHTPHLVGKQVVFLLSGPLGQLPNLREMLEAYFELQRANLVGMVSDESGASAEIDRLLDQVLRQAVENAEAGYVRPQTFLGVGGITLFRDAIYSPLRAVFMADHRAYRRMGIYKTFPQANLWELFVNSTAAAILNLPPIRRWFDPHIKEGMIQPLKRVVEKTGEVP